MVNNGIDLGSMPNETVVKPPREKINAPHIKGPHLTNWGFSEWTPDDVKVIVALKKTED